MLWECGDCGYVLASDPLASDDWGGEPYAVGPDCPDCDVGMNCIANDGDVCPICGGSGGGDEPHLCCRFCVDGKVWRGGKSISVFTHCNVCGCPLRTEDEDKMGMCERCAQE